MDNNTGNNTEYDNNAEYEDDSLPTEEEVYSIPASDELENLPAIGEYIRLGSYEQDNNESNGKEDIEWVVLDVDEPNQRMLLLSRYLLDCKPYDNSDTKSGYWKNCTLRSWLNNTFYNDAFNETEKTKIQTTTLENGKNPSYGTRNGDKSGSKTKDKVFLLDIRDLKNTAYGFSDSTYDKARRCPPTDYAEAKGCYAELDGTIASVWWLRSPGGSYTWKACVSSDGSINDLGKEQQKEYGVRPAMWVEFHKKNKNDNSPNQVGKYIIFGAYEQDNDTSNGKEKIEWIVLDIDETNKKALILSKYALDSKPFNINAGLVRATWEECTLRSWLNETFFDSAFDSSEKEKIQTTTLLNAYKEADGTVVESITKDRIFLLSIDDVTNEKYGFDSLDSEDKTTRRCQPTDYASAQGCGSNYCCWWWLRSPLIDGGFFPNSAAIVRDDGFIYSDGYGDYSMNDIGVRPAMWINFE